MPERFLDEYSRGSDAYCGQEEPGREETTSLLPAVVKGGHRDRDAEGKKNLLDPLERAYVAILVQELYTQCQRFASTFLQYEAASASTLQMLPMAIRQGVRRLWTVTHVSIFYLCFLLGWLWLRGIKVWQGFHDVSKALWALQVNLIMQLVLASCCAFLVYRAAGDLTGSWSRSLRRTLRWGLITLVVVIFLSAVTDSLGSVIKNLQESAGAVPPAVLGAWNVVQSSLEDLDIASAKEKAATWLGLSEAQSFRDWMPSGLGLASGRLQALSTSMAEAKHQTSFLLGEFTIAHPALIRCLSYYQWMRQQVDILGFVTLVIYAYIIFPRLLMDLMGLMASFFCGSNVSRKERDDAHFMSFRFPQFAQVKVHSRSASALVGRYEELDLVLVPARHRLGHTVLESAVHFLCKPGSPPLLYYVGIKLHRVMERMERHVNLKFCKPLSPTADAGTTMLQFVMRHRGTLEGTAKILPHTATVEIVELTSKADKKKFVIRDRQDVYILLKEDAAAVATCRICHFGNGTFGGECRRIRKCELTSVASKALLLLFGDSSWTLHQTVLLGQCLKEAVGDRYEIITAPTRTSQLRPEVLLGRTTVVVCIGDGYVQASMVVADPIVMMQRLFLYEPTVNLRLMRNRGQVSAFVGCIQNRKFYSASVAHREEVMSVLGPTCHYTDWVEEEEPRSHDQINLNPFVVRKDLVLFISSHV